MQIRIFRGEEFRDSGTLGDELERLRDEILALPLTRLGRWLLTRKLDQIEARLSEARNAAISRYLES